MLLYVEFSFGIFYFHASGGLDSLGLDPCTHKSDSVRNKLSNFNSVLCFLGCGYSYLYKICQS